MSCVWVWLVLHTQMYTIPLQNDWSNHKQMRVHVFAHKPIKHYENRINGRVNNLILSFFFFFFFFCYFLLFWTLKNIVLSFLIWMAFLQNGRINAVKKMLLVEPSFTLDVMYRCIDEIIHRFRCLYLIVVIYILIQLHRIDACLDLNYLLCANSYSFYSHFLLIFFASLIFFFSLLISRNVTTNYND